MVATHTITRDDGENPRHAVYETPLRDLEGQCVTCGSRYKGKRTAHCTICHRTFTSVTAFDLHEPSYRGCTDPARVAYGPKHQWAGRRRLELVTLLFRGEPYQAWGVCIYTTGEE